MAESGRRPNANTGPAASEAAPRVDLGSLARTWAEEVPGLAAMAPRDPRAASFRIFWTRSGSTGFRDFTPGAGQHLVIGRHTACDIVLAQDEDLSLRHLLVTAEGGVNDPALRLVDLRAALPMYAQNDRAERSLSFQGPFAVRLGTYVLGGFRVGAGALPVPRELPAMEALEHSGMPTPPLSPTPKSTVVGHGSMGGGRPRTLMTSMPRPSTLVEIADATAQMSGAVAQLIGQREGRFARVALRDTDLRAGVLVGRADKCLDKGLRQVMSEHISRVHAVLLMDDRRTVWVYDAASTNGTYVGGSRVRSATLAEVSPFTARSQVVLGDGIKIDLAPPR